MKEREKLVESMVTFFPMLHKKVAKHWPACELSKMQFDLLFRIFRYDQKPMSFYSEKMMMSRSNLTALCDKLIEEGLVERLPDPNDRRVIILKLTPKGEGYIAEHREQIRTHMLKMLEQLDDNDVSKLNQSIEEMKTILSKMF